MIFLEIPPKNYFLLEYLIVLWENIVRYFYSEANNNPNTLFSYCLHTKCMSDCYEILFPTIYPLFILQD